MIDHGKQNLLGILIDAVDYEAAVEKIISAAHAREPFAVSALAVHGVMTGVQDEQHAYRLNRLNLVVPDGQPVRWALNLLHNVNLPDRVYGPTLMLKVCERAADEGLPLYFYGNEMPVLKLLSERLCARFPKLEIAGMAPSKFRQLNIEEQHEAAARISASGAAITLVGLGCPRQEVWVYEHLPLLNMPAMAIGAAFNFHAGYLAQAPQVLQDWGLEWVFRFVHEPKRLWKRYVLLNPQYMSMVARQYFQPSAFPCRNSHAPTMSLRYG